MVKLFKTLVWQTYFSVARINFYVLWEKLSRTLFFIYIKFSSNLAQYIQEVKTELNQRQHSIIHSKTFEGQYRQRKKQRLEKQRQEQSDPDLHINCDSQKANDKRPRKKPPSLAITWPKCEAKWRSVCLEKQKLHDIFHNLLENLLMLSNVNIFNYWPQVQWRADSRKFTIYIWLIYVPL